MLSHIGQLQLTNADDVGEGIVKHAVGEHQVHHSVHVCVEPKVLVVVAREGIAQPMVVIHHAGHAIKAVAIKLVLVNPPAGIAEQEAQCLPVACVHNPR
jgi:hypothetical protein